jgi:16S rRNA (guanine527-N7)-methyltransferase
MMRRRRFHVKHLGQEHRDYFAGLLEKCDIALSDGQVELMLQHLDFVLDWNQRINLTSINEPYEAVRLHLIDSLLARADVDACLDGPLCDIGSGAGFPGLPLAIATGRSTVLVESVKKKAGVVSSLLGSSAQGPFGDVQVFPVRAEEYAGDHGGRAAVVTARALSQLSSLIELASPLLKRGGSLVALKGTLSPEEAQSARRVASLVGMEITGIRATALPGGHESRTLVTVTKAGESMVALPRRTGLAQKEPLGGTSLK